MKKTLLTAIVLVGLTFSLNAQASNTFKGSSGTFKTFTDTYMDVQYFTTQDYPKDFGYISSESKIDNIPTLELSYAHQFKKTKFGLFLDTNLIPVFSKTTQGDVSQTSTSFGRAFTKAFWGFSNHGLSISFGGNTSRENTVQSAAEEGVNAETHQHTLDKMKGNITWGGSFELANFYFKPRVAVDIDTISSVYYESVPDTEGNSSYSDGESSNTDIVATLGSIFDLKTTNTLHHEIGVNAKGGYRLEKNIVTTKETERTTQTSDGFIIGLDADYKLTYSVEDKLQLALKTGINTSFIPFTEKAPVTSEVVSKSFDMILDPFINFGLIYNIKKDAVALVLGTDFTIPTVQYHKDMDKDGNKVVSYTKFSKLVTNVNAGINWNFNKNVGMDASIILPISPVVGEGFKFSLGVTLQK